MQQRTKRKTRQQQQNRLGIARQTGTISENLLFKAGTIYWSGFEIDVDIKY